MTVLNRTMSHSLEQFWCGTCDIKFRTGRLLRRHAYFKHQMVSRKASSSVECVSASTNAIPVVPTTDSKAVYTALPTIKSFGPLVSIDFEQTRNIAATRRQILVETQQRVAVLKKALSPRIISKRVQRQRASIFPPPVPQYRPPVTTRQEADKVKKILFSSPEAAGECRDRCRD